MLLVSCGPINYFTRIKKVPREYSLNYCGEDIKAPSSEINKESWIVFSDRDENYTYQNPGGKVKYKKTNFLDPFFVIGVKGDYLKLVKYDPSIIENSILSSKFKDRKKAEYYGWIHKSRVILNRYTTTDIASNFRNKSIVMISDTISLSEPALYFKDDSVKVFKNPELSILNKTISFYDIVYTLKYTADRSKQVIVYKQQVHPDSVQSDVAGWIHSGLVQNIGQRLFIDKKDILDNNLLFTNKNKLDTLDISDSIIEINELKARYYNKTLSNIPVTSFSEKDSTFRLKLRLPMPVINQSLNYVFNVNGNKIYYNQFNELQKNLNLFNIIFVFESKREIIDNFPAMINVIQNLQPLFEEDTKTNYRYGAVLATGGNYRDKKPFIRTQALTPQYNDLLEFLIGESEILNNYAPLPTEATWSGVRKATEMLSDHKNETNLMVIIGESGYAENVDSTLVRKISDLNTRILGFQVYNEEDNPGNNFVLQVQNLINYYADRNKTTKREKIVFTDQLNNNNRYREAARNIYALDYPKRSMSQGWVLFPEKQAASSLDMLANSIDTIVSEIKSDNNDIIYSLNKAFNTVGNHRYTYDSIFIDYFNLKNPINNKISTYFTKMPLWYIPSHSFDLKKQTLDADSVIHKPAFLVLLSKEELDNVVDFIDRLSAKEPDYKYSASKRKTKKVCDCPDDDEFEEPQPEEFDENGAPIYRSTGGIRRYLQNVYLTELRTCKLCNITKAELKTYSLALAQQKIMGCPTYTELLKKYLIDDIRNPEVISDKELDSLILYFKTKKDNLVKYIQNADTFESNGQTYYWVNQNYLP